MKSYYLYFLYIISFPSMAATDYEAELINFVGKLNKVFSLNITTQKREICAFGANLSTIAYCQKDIDVFNTLAPEDKPLESLFTIIGHEYAHILFDYDKTQEARTVYQDSYISSLDLALKKIQADPARIHQIELSTYRNSSSLKEKVSDFIGVTQHENIDALGTKLVFLAGYEPNPKSTQLLLRFGESQGRLVYRSWIGPRENVIQVAKDDGLERWSNFRCLGKAFIDLHSNQILRTGLANLGEDRFLIDLTYGCTVEESVQAILERLDVYYPMTEFSK